MSNSQSNQQSNPNMSPKADNKNSTDGEKKKSAPEYPPATEASKRTNSINFGEDSEDDNIAKF
ncbi:MAG: hypothetical protein HC874_29030 [Richelia sp. SL_2_1]|nr:hypothetical protein [Richelia sp. SM1_7_0]NJO31144.1 hypothetical protein [Richelia sp. SL_2_1]